MVSKSNVIETNSKCICGNGDMENSQKNYFENKCQNCGKEGTLQLETENNKELSNFSSDDNTDDIDTTVESPPMKIVCKYCGSEYCGQDGYDLLGGNRGVLNTVNPNEITDEDEEVSSTEENETTYMSGWEGLCDLLKPLDAQAMMVQRGDYVIIKKIEMPQSARLWAYEGINVVDDSVKITDYTPEIYNTFIILWGESFENELEFVFSKHKQLFGERKIVMEATKVQVAEEESEEGSENSDNSESSEGNSESNKKTNNSSSIFDVISNAKSNESTKTPTTTDVDLADASGESSEEGDEEAPETEEVPITDRDEAIQFGLTQVGKAKREDGHTIELKVIGNHNWQMGEWCHVKLPSFDEDSYMFISKCGFETSPDNEYINSITLVDYPPSLGKPKTTTTDENSEESEEETDENSEENSDENSNENNSDSNENSNN